jgi:hypothetical protein
VHTGADKQPSFVSNLSLHVCPEPILVNHLFDTKTVKGGLVSAGEYRRSGASSGGEGFEPGKAGHAMVGKRDNAQGNEKNGLFCLHF